jgi:hypothetical protein
MRVLTRTRCRHESCGCPAHADFAPYCSAYCAHVAHEAETDTETETAGACSCEHAACGRRLREQGPVTPVRLPVARGPAQDEPARGRCR